MPRLRSVPPGRAGQVWLAHRLQVARRGADLLDHKLRILREESVRLTLLTERTGNAWATAAREARQWQVRADLLAGDRGRRAAAPRAAAEVEVRWEHRMGVTYPADAELVLPRPSTQDLPAASAAVTEARRAHARALDAAVQHAVARSASVVLSVEVTRTRHRLRALTTRWIPTLEHALRQTVLGLEEQEHQDAVRLRWAHGPERTGSR